MFVIDVYNKSICTILIDWSRLLNIFAQYYSKNIFNFLAYGFPRIA